MVNTCVVVGCNFSSSRWKRQGKEHVSIHVFPKKKDLRAAWIKAVRRESWSPTNYSGVCSQHFREEDMDLTGQTRRIREGAVPSVFPAYPSYYQKMITPRKPPNRQGVGDENRQGVGDESLQGVGDEILQGVGDEILQGVGDESLQGGGDEILQGVGDENLRVACNSSSSSRNEPDIADLSPRKRKLMEVLREKNIELTSAKKKIKVLQQKIRRKEKRMQTDREIIDSMLNDKVINENSAEMLKNSLPSDVCCLLAKAAQNADTHSSKPGLKYNPELRSFALTLHYLSPKAYDFVRVKFNNALPSPRTIRSWYMKLNCEPGFSQECFNTIKEKIKGCIQKGTVPLVALSIDDMCLKEHIDYANNKIVGYVDLGTEINSDCLPTAKMACVIMCTAVMDSWKIPCGYFFIESLSGEERATLIKSCIEKLHDIGVRVISVTFDGSSCNLSMSRCLGADLCNKNNFSTVFPHPSLPSSFVAVLLDACHMVKLVRNCLAEKKVIYTPNGEIKWSFIQSLFELQSSEGLHLANKLSNKHLLWFKNKMRVRLAVQTLSNSVAEALQFCDKHLGLQEFSGCDETVKFITTIDRTFDLLNSSSKFGKGHKAPLTVENATFCQQFIHETLSYINSLYVDKECKLQIINSNRKVGFLGLKVSLLSVRALFNLYVIRTHKLNYLLTYKLSQDPLELFFGLIRQRGGWNVNPTCLQFKSAFKRLVTRNQLKCKKTGNCLSQDNFNILFVSSSHEVQTSHFATSQPDSSAFHVPESDYFSLDAAISQLSENVVEYIAGFVVKKIINTLKCDQCINAVIQANAANDFLSFKNKGGLFIPSRDVLKVCRMTELAVRECGANLQRILKRNVPCQVAIQACELNLFSSLKSHSLDLNPLDTHICRLIKVISQHYLQVRVAHMTKLVNDNKLDHRSVYNRLAIFKHL